MDTVPISPLSSHPIYSSGLELAFDQDKECVKCDPQHICRNCNARWQDFEPLMSPPGTITKIPTFKERLRSLYHKTPYYLRILVVALIVAIIAISVSLGIVLQPKPPSGLYKNGSGIVALDRGDNSSMVDIFFQHATGQIRHVVLDNKNTTWSSGLSTDVVLGQYASPPRQGTPLMAVSYTIGNETTWKVFYIDSNNILQESTASTTTSTFPTTWMPGTLGLGQIKASSSPHTGLSVCKNMLWAPDPSGFNDGSLVLMYGGADGLNHMLTHDIQDTTWKFNYTFINSSSDSGIECTSRGSEILDTWMISSQGELMQASYNFNASSHNNTLYPGGEWTTGIVYNQAIQTPTSISAIKYTGNSSVFVSDSTFVYFIAPGGIVTEINVDTYNRSHTPVLTKTPPSNFSTKAVVDQSKIASVAVMTIEDPITQVYGRDRLVFFQLQSNSMQISFTSENFLDNPLSSTSNAVGSSNIGR